ncbi:MAG: serine hydrolase domain-containing protein [Cyanobacteria bacterium P01_F01_bin.86]
MFKSAHIYLIFVGFILIVGCDLIRSPSPSLPADIDSARSSAIADIRQTLDSLELEGLYGVAYLTDQDSVVIHEALGFRDRETRDVMQVTTGFDIGSITKAMTAAAVLKLEEQGKLQLSDTVSRFFPNTPSPLLDVTITQLMDHTSGLPEYIGEDYELVSKQQVLQRIFEADLLFEPGSNEAYSNTGYTLLAMIIEEVSGQAFEQVLRESVLLPAAPQIGYQLADWESAALAVGYVQDEDRGTPLDKPWREDGPSWTLRGNGGLLSTAEDVAQWFEAMFEGRILGPDALSKFQERFAGSGPYGIRIGEAGGDDLTGFNAQHEAWPEVGVSWTMVTSRSSYPAEEIWESVEESVYKLVEIASQAES